MGCFIISRTPSGDRFLLQSEAGRTLITSKDYATLDACKKGICSLVYYAPIAPVVDTSAGEYGPNPKIEITAGADGLYYDLRSANGKSVVQDGPFATKKACLRAVAMLRTGVQGAEVFFARPAGFERLTVGNLIQDSAPQVAYTATVPESSTAEAAPAPIAEVPATAAEKPAPAAEKPTPAAEKPAPAAERPATVKVARKLPAASTARPAVQNANRPAAKPTPKPAAKGTGRSAAKPAVSKSLFSRLFKR